MMKFYAYTLVVLLCSIYVTRHYRKPVMLYKIRKLQSKSACTLKEMGVVFNYNNISRKNYKEESIELGKFTFTYHVFLHCKTSMRVECDGMLMRYEDISFQFRKAIYIIFLKRRYSRLFRKLSIEKKEILQKISRDVEKNDYLKPVENHLKDVIELLF